LVAIVALVFATTPQYVEASEVKETDSPSLELNLAVEIPQLTKIVVGKSIADEKAENEAKILAEKETQRIKYLASQKKTVKSQSDAKSGVYVKIIGESNEQCVVYAHRISGNNKIRGYAGNLVAEGLVPKVGALALEKDHGHVSIVVSIDGDFLILHDANWVRGSITERRVLASTQRGFIY
jgi:hypothetical protein